MVSTFYEIEGERYPRVTTICAIVANEELAYWRGRVGNTEADRVSREATGIGKRAHALIEAYAKRRACDHVPMCPELPCAEWWERMALDVHPLVRAYVEWHDEHVRAVVAVEKLTISRLHKFAGTVDQVAFIDDDRQSSVIDIKTSNNASASWGLQTAAYQLALDEEDIECGRRLILQLPSKEPGAIYVHDLVNHEQDQRAFLNALKLYRWKLTQQPPQPTGPRIRFGGRR